MLSGLHLYCEQIPQFPGTAWSYNNCKHIIINIIMDQAVQTLSSKQQRRLQTWQNVWSSNRIIKVSSSVYNTPYVTIGPFISCLYGCT